MDDRVETGPLGVPDPIIERRKRPAVVEIGHVYDVAGSSQFLGEREEPRGLSLRVVKQQYLGHCRDGVRLISARPLLSSVCLLVVSRTG